MIIFNPDTDAAIHAEYASNGQYQVWLHGFQEQPVAMESLQFREYIQQMKKAGATDVLDNIVALLGQEFVEWQAKRIGK